MWLYNGTCLASCPAKTFQSSKIDNVDNVTVIDICVDCLAQCGSCINQTECSNCDPNGGYKFEFFNATNNSTDCLSQCPIDGYYEGTVTVNSTNNTNTTTNTTTQVYQC